MTREELIEVMARAILLDHEDGANMDTHAVPERAASRHAIAALTALEAAGVRLVSFAALAEDDEAVLKVAQAISEFYGTHPYTVARAAIRAMGGE